MITGAHTVIYSTDAEADRAFLRDVLGLRSVDAGEGWLIFAASPGEIAVHPADVDNRHELYLLCDDADALVANLQRQGHACPAIAEMPWGRLTYVTLPGGGKLGVYQPRHAQPERATPLR
jgi:catechol 2,3-dioxygenase-like lactoylglutathione lyase family enzyme